MDIQTYLRVILDFLNIRVVPFLLLLAFLFFLWNVMRFFVWHGDEEDGRASAKSLAIWGITAFAVIGTLWGLVNLGLQVFGISNRQQPLQGDYIMIKGGSSGGAGNTSGGANSNYGLNDPVTPEPGGMDDNLP